MPVLWAAFIMGLAGGMHCLLMCGPLATSALSMRRNSPNPALNSMMYHGGRLTAYLIIGIIFGLLGQVFSLFFYQQALSVISGALLLLWVGTQVFKKNRLAGSILKIWNRLVSGHFSKLWKSRSVISLFSLGLLNGFLPCGLVYLAATASLNQASLAYSIIFMLFFGMGTLPLMLGLRWFQNLAPAGLKLNLRRLMPVFLSMLGMLFIIRGLNLNIPYLSPYLAHIQAGIHQGPQVSAMPICH